MKIKLLPWKRDRWNSTDGNIIKYDKVEHIIRDCVTLLASLLIWGLAWPVFVSWAAWIIGYEIKDGLVPYDGVHIQGFSIKDAMASFSGGIPAMALYAIIQHFLIWIR